MWSLRFAPFADGVDSVAVHKQFFAMNGFEVPQVPEPSSVCTLLASLFGLGLLRKRALVVSIAIARYDS
ncbi:MAG: PEP-CTERM sorting domain-containing protein [Pirellulaceae bacterium]